MINKYGAIFLALSLSACASLDLPDLQEARYEVEQGDFEQAEYTLRRLVQYKLTESDRLSANYLLADVYQQTGKFDAALRLYRTFGNKRPNALNKMVKLLNTHPQLAIPADCSLLRNGGVDVDVNYALLLSKGICGQSDADGWLDFAARQGNSEALLALAAGTEKDRSKAISLVLAEDGINNRLIPRLASFFKEGNFEADLALLLDETRNLPLPAETHYKLAAYRPPAEEINTYRWIQKSYPAAQLAIARFALRHPDLVEEQEYQNTLVQARTNKSLVDQISLTMAEDFTWGHRGIQDPELALQKLIGLEENPRSKYLRGQIYRHGFLGTADPKLALDLLNESASEGNKNAWIALAEIYEEGRIVCADSTRARGYRQEAARH